MLLRWISVSSLLWMCLAASGRCQESGTNPAPPSGNQRTLPVGAVMRMELSGPLNLGHVHPGTELDGQIARPVFVVDREVIPRGSHLHLVVEGITKQKAAHSGFIQHLEDINGLAHGHHAEYSLTFRAASLTLPDGEVRPLDLKFVDGGKVVHLHTKGSQVEVSEGSALAKAAPGIGKVEQTKEDVAIWQQYRHPLMTLEVEEAVPFDLPSEPASAVSSASGDVTIASGTKARLLLLTAVSSSENKPGDAFQARLLEPISSEGHLILPEGTLFEGHIRKVVPPRRMSRGGFLYLGFDDFRLQDGSAQKVAAALTATELDKSGHAEMDPEGGLHGGRRGAKKVAADLAVGLVADQITDEAVELAVHAVAPYAGAAVGLASFMGRHGHHVGLPRYSECIITFSRSVTLPGPATPPVADAKQDHER